MATSIQTKKPNISGSVFLVVGIMAGLIILIILGSTVAFVTAGTSPVLLDWGAVNYGVHLHPGLNFIIPIQESVVLMSTQVQVYQTKSTAASKDLQDVNADVAVNFHIDGSYASQIYNDYSLDYGNRLIVPSVQEVVKATMANYTAEQLITERPLVVDGIKNGLEKRLSPFHMLIDAVAIQDFQFSPEFTSAIERKVVAQQNLLTNLTQLNITRIQANKTVAFAEGNATSRIVLSRGNASAILIRANATAKAIEVINAQVANSPAYLRYLTITQWNGHVPLVEGGNGAIPLLNINITNSSR